MQYGKYSVKVKNKWTEWFRSCLVGFYQHVIKYTKQKRKDTCWFSYPNYAQEKLKTIFDDDCRIVSVMPLFNSLPFSLAVRTRPKWLIYCFICYIVNVRPQTLSNNLRDRTKRVNKLLMDRCYSYLPSHNDSSKLLCVIVARKTDIKYFIGFQGGCNTQSITWRV